MCPNLQIIKENECFSGEQEIEIFSVQELVTERGPVKRAHFKIAIKLGRRE